MKERKPSRSVFQGRALLWVATHTDFIPLSNANLFLLRLSTREVEWVIKDCGDPYAFETREACSHTTVIEFLPDDLFFAL